MPVVCQVRRPAKNVSLARTLLLPHNLYATSVLSTRSRMRLGRPFAMIVLQAIAPIMIDRIIVWLGQQVRQPVNQQVPRLSGLQLSPLACLLEDQLVSLLEVPPLSLLIQPPNPPHPRRYTFPRISCAQATLSVP